MLLRLVPIFCLINACAATEKFVIGAFPHEGLFSSFLCVLSNMLWAEKNGKVPVVYWNEKSLYYQKQGYNGQSNAWEYYFYPVSEAIYEPSDAEDVWLRGDAPDGLHILTSFFKDSAYFHAELKFQAHELIKKAIRIKPCIESKIDAFYEKNMAGKTTVGIHLRGTDGAIRIDKMGLALAMFQAAETELEEPIQFLVASDDQCLLDLAKTHFQGRIIFYNSHRSQDGTPLHIPKEREAQTALAGEEALIEAMLLSRCDFLIFSHSSLPVSVLTFNPWMKNIYVDPFPWIHFLQPAQLKPTSGR